MNWLILLVAIILIFYGINGQRRGLIRTVFVMFSTIIALILTGTITPSVSKAVQSNEKIMTVITQAIENMIDSTEVEDKKTDEIQFIDELPIPSALKTGLLENNTVDMYKAMAVESFQQYIANYLTRIMVNALVYVVVFLIIKVLLMVISHVLHIVSKLPIINGINKTAGLFVGLVHGMLIIWIGCIVINVLSASPLGQYMYEEISKSQLLSFIYNNNLLLEFVTDIGKIVF